MARPCVTLLGLLLPVIAGGSLPCWGPRTGASPQSTAGSDLYRAIKAFTLSGGCAKVESLKLARDRATMVFTGTFCFTAPVGGRVTGAVFLGQGTFRAEVPESKFEQDHVRRLIGTSTVESDFRTAVLRFTDDTFERLRAGATPEQPPQEAVDLAAAFEARMLKETGANVAARLAVSLLNEEDPGVFVAQFDRGRRGRFTLLLDHQSRIPVAAFRINGGEKGLVFAYKAGYFANDVWMAFYALDDHARGHASYSDAFNLVETARYQMDIDLRNPRRALVLDATMEMIGRAPAVRAIPMNVSEDLDEYQNARLKLAMRVKSATLSGGPAVDFVQEDWEGGLTLFLPDPCREGDRLSVRLHLEGDFLRDVEGAHGNHYPLSNTSWYPRHGYLQRSLFDLTFRHSRTLKVASVGTRVQEDPSPDNKDETVTRFRIDSPVSLAAFALGPFVRHAEPADMQDGTKIPIELYAMPSAIHSVKESFVLAEMGNSLRYFSALFGRYPYPVFRAALHPYAFGQGMPTVLLIPPADRATPSTFKFLAHETSHQWWGHMVVWRSYRDQWLSEGFAEYSGLLYVGRRGGSDAARRLIDNVRESLRSPPLTALGMGRGRLTDVGPLIMGHRLATRETADAYSALIYGKGALVLRMLHMLLTDPGTGNGQPFFDMMSAFVHRHQNGAVSTDDFLAVANEHFARTPIALKSGLQDLGWFFRQFVYDTVLPSYRLEYALEQQPDGTCFLKGTVFVEGVPEGQNWFMPLPVIVRLGGDRIGRTLAYAVGRENAFNLRLPNRPDAVELDPDAWVLSEKTTIRKTR